MSTMEDVSGVPVPAGGEIRFAPGGFHLMCMGPTAAVKPGGSIVAHPGVPTLVPPATCGAICSAQPIKPSVAPGVPLYRATSLGASWL